jgi:hypothetical protein
MPASSVVTPRSTYSQPVMRMSSGFRRGHALRVAHAVGEIAAVGIGASVGDRRKKAVQQKAVGGEQIADGAAVVQAPVSGASGLPSSHGSLAEPLRPAWAS